LALDPIEESAGAALEIDALLQRTYFSSRRAVSGVRCPRR
jgi:hypothetical protein